MTASSCFTKYSIDITLKLLIFDGKIEDLTLTKNAQPAIMATSIAILKTLESEGFNIIKTLFVAGHSLGEYTALCATGAISLGDTANLLKMRGIFMQESVPVGVGAMAAILGLDLNKVKLLINDIKSDEICEIANDNEPNQVVLSGNRLTIEKVCKIAKTLGAKRAILLPVSAPFHCSLMVPAQKNMIDLISEISLKKPTVPVISNITAAPTQNPEEIRENLIKQITGRVRWRETIINIINAGNRKFIEIGPGKVLSGLIKRIDRNMEVIQVNNMLDLNNLNNL